MRVRLRQGASSEVLGFHLGGIDRGAPPLLSAAALPLALVPAMKLGSPLRFSTPLPGRLLAGARRFQEILSTWYPELRPVELRASEAPEHGSPTGAGTGVFFSGGLDSTYSLLKHRGELTHAVFVHGCDIPLEDVGYRDKAWKRLGETARACGVELISVRTDLLRFSDRYCHWGKHYHGAAFAAIAMFLSGTLGKVYLASSTSYRRITPWGSSAVTDPLWASQAMDIVYDGAEAERLEKVRALRDLPVALQNLRVCFGNPEAGLNCGRCEKCYRTMVALRLCGVLTEGGAFPLPLDLEAMVSHQGVIEKFGELRSWRLNREAALEAGADLPLIGALEELHRRSAHHGVARLLAVEKREVVASAHWKAHLPKFRTALWESLRDEDPEWFAERVMAWLPRRKDQAFDRLAGYDRRWFRRRVWSRRWRRLWRRLSRSRPAAGGRR